MQEQRTRAEEGNEMILRRLNKRVLNRIGRREGFTILEILITICILVFGFLATVSMHFASEQENATGIAASTVTNQFIDRKEVSNKAPLTGYNKGYNLQDENDDHTAVDIRLNIR